MVKVTVAHDEEPSLPSPGTARGGEDDMKIIVCKLERPESTTKATKHRASAAMFDFADKEDMKEKVRQSMTKEPYSVDQFYRKDRVWSKIATDSRFENATLGVIVVNAIWMAVDTDWNMSDSVLTALPIFQAAEHLFCAYFSFEWFVRFMAFERKLDGLHDRWFVFDTTLVFMMVIETWIFTVVIALVGGDGGSPLGNASILRLLRLLRLSRLMRMLRSLPELMILVKGMAFAMNSVLSVMCLLVALTYVFAIAFTQLSHGMQFRDKYFAHVLLSMYSLLIYGTFLDDLSGFCDDIRAESEFCLMLVLLYICLASLTVLNMLVGVLCEVVQAVADKEQEEMTIRRVVDSMKEILNMLDDDGNDMISFNELKAIMENKQALDVLEEVGIDPAYLVDFADLFFIQDGESVELSFDQFMELLLDLCGTNIATVQDVMRMGKTLNSKLDSNKAALAALSNKTKRLEEASDSNARIGKQLSQVLAAVRSHELYPIEQIALEGLCGGDCAARVVPGIWQLSLCGVDLCWPGRLR